MSAKVGGDLFGDGDVLVVAVSSHVLRENAQIMPVVSPSRRVVAQLYVEGDMFKSVQIKTVLDFLFLRVPFASHLTEKLVARLASQPVIPRLVFRKTCLVAKLPDSLVVRYDLLGLEL